MQKKMSKYQVQVVGVVLITGVALALAGSAYFWGLPLIEKSRGNVDVTQAQQFMQQLAQAMEEVGATGNTRTLSVDLKGRLKVDTQNDIIDYSISSGVPSYASTMFVPLDDNIPYKQEVYIGDKNKQVEISECNSNANGCYATYDSSSNKLKFQGSCISSVAGKEFNNGDKITCVKNGQGDSFIIHLEDVKDYGFWFLEGQNIVKLYGVEGINKPLVLMAKSVYAPGTKNFVDIFRIFSREIDDPNTHTGRYYDIEDNSQLVAGPGKVQITISRGNGDLIPGGSALGGDLNKIRVYVNVQ